MAKIQLSALASQINGKLGGSVFLNTAGGLAIRQNKANNPLKNNSSRFVASRFGSVSSQWRNLSIEERQLWKDFAFSKQVTTIYNTPRTPSGYETFCKINAVRLNAGKSIITTPPVIRSLPVELDIEISTPDMYLFRAPILWDINNACHANNSTLVKFSFPDFVFNQFEKLMFSFQIGKMTHSLVQSLNDQKFKIQYYQDSSQVAFEIFFKPNTNADCNLYLRRIDGAKDSSSFFTIPYDKFNEVNTFAFKVNSFSNNDAIVYINNIQPILANTESIGIVSTPSSLFGVSFNFNSTSSMPFFLGSFVINDNLKNELSIKKFIDGYTDIIYDVLLFAENQSELLGYTYEHGSMSSMLEFVDGDFSTPINKFARQFNNYRFYQLAFEYTGTELTDWSVQLFSTPPTSLGRESTTYNNRLVGDVGFALPSGADLTGIFRRAFIDWQAGQDFIVQYRLIHNESGLAYAKEPAKKKPKKVDRFKPGTALVGTPT